MRDELTIQVHNFYSNAIGGIRLEVPIDKIDEARKLLVASGFESCLIEADQEILETAEEHSNSGLLKFLKYAIPFIIIAGLVLILVVAILLFNE